MELYYVFSLLLFTSAVRGATVAPTRTANAVTENSTEITTFENETQMALDDDDANDDDSDIGDESADVRGDLIFVVSELVKLYKHFRRADVRIFKKSALKNLMFIFRSVSELLLGPYVSIVTALKSVFTPAFTKALIFIVQMINKF